MNRMTRQILLLVLAAFAVLAGMSLSRWVDETPAGPSAATAYPPRPLPAFELVDHRGEPFTRADLEGHWSVLFFGLTHCHDVCPLTLAVLANALEHAPGEAPIADVVLVSVDPERDTPERLARYVAGFDQDFTGVTGTPEAIGDLAVEVGVAYGRSPVDAAGNYTVDHTAALFVVNPDGELTAVFTPPLDAAAIRSDLEVLRRSRRGS
jgi:protein SCO1/2